MLGNSEEGKSAVFFLILNFLLGLSKNQASYETINLIGSCTATVCKWG